MNRLNHPVLGNVRYTSVPLSLDPDTQVQQAIALMSRYAIADAQTPEVMKDAEYAAGEGGGDPVEGAYRYAKRKLRFVEDASILTNPDVVEVLIRPVDVSLISRMGGTGFVQGDCDDFSMYVAALLLAQNVACTFATVAADPESPDAYSHVYVVAYPQAGKRVPVDASHGKHVGWEAPSRFGKMREWDLYESARGSSDIQAGALIAFALAGLGVWWMWQQSKEGRYDD